MEVLKIIGKAFLCGIAGAVAWIVTAPMFPTNSFDIRWAGVEQFFPLLLTSLISLSAGVFQGMQRGGKINIFIMGALSLVFGTLGGMMGYGLGGTISSMFFPQAFITPGLTPVQIIARTFVMIPVGLLLGGGVGLSLRSWRGFLSGALGGLLGGIVAGLTFDVIGSAVGNTISALQSGNEVGTISRGVTAVILGFSVGLFTGIFDLTTRQAWVRLVLGRNEGREWPLDYAQNFIGRDERAQVPLFADPQLPPMAAVIVKQGTQYVLQDPGSPIGVGLNGYKVTNSVLTPGDMIQVGSLQLQFLMKDGAARRAMEGRSAGVPVGGAPMQPMQQMQPVQPIQQPYSQPAPSQPTVAFTPPSNPTMAVSPQSGVLSLVVLSGPMTGQRIPINGPFEIGREADGLRLTTDAQASRRHASLMPMPGGLAVTDLSSTNGTFVNDARVNTASLKIGDKLRVGSTEFRVEG